MVFRKSAFGIWGVARISPKREKNQPFKDAQKARLLVFARKHSNFNSRENQLAAPIKFTKTVFENRCDISEFYGTRENLCSPKPMSYEI